ncbi:hypothetical protein GLAREA_06594 [Glarea lozoyensis ATCC 20868]|uniref:Apple domain-containing protein n=1 Tax=Glarea lozoyensis (strain ATCC 20868 / MF5171) TaxID=1116229 RepID=S3DNA8_GLAL2|nr:uncharacterized protein GLAREA_06594 [Glarea lozoyensis ATCC 20868]EPE33581.1 hypothetical protein GLAREA_06594 [Glarea lozoyensis ATCC 20868]
MSVILTVQQPAEATKATSPECSPPPTNFYVTKTGTTTLPISTYTTSPTTYITTYIEISTSSTLSALCPTAPSPQYWCRLADSKRFEFLIGEYKTDDPPKCQELCLRDPKCKSYTINEELPTTRTWDCRLWNETAGNGNGGPRSEIGVLYDRDCGYLFPKCCSSLPTSKPTITPTSTPPITAPPSLSTAPPRQKRDHTLPCGNGYCDYPYWLEIDDQSMWYYCHCIIETPNPASSLTWSDNVSVNLPQVTVTAALHTYWVTRTTWLNHVTVCEGLATGR